MGAARCWPELAPGGAPAFWGCACAPFLSGAAPDLPSRRAPRNFLRSNLARRRFNTRSRRGRAGSLRGRASQHLRPWKRSASLNPCWRYLPLSKGPVLTKLLDAGCASVLREKLDAGGFSPRLELRCFTNQPGARRRGQPEAAADWYRAPCGPRPGAARAIATRRQKKLIVGVWRGLKTRWVFVSCAAVWVGLVLFAAGVFVSLRCCLHPRGQARAPIDSLHAAAAGQILPAFGAARARQRVSWDGGRLGTGGCLLGCRLRAALPFSQAGARLEGFEGPPTADALPFSSAARAPCLAVGMRPRRALGPSL